MWRTVQCAVQGRSHVKSQVPCQDKTFSSSKNSVTVVALADGAGSAHYSHFGAECTTKYICEQLCDKFESFYNESDGTLVKKEILAKLLDQLEVLAVQLECEIKDLASTLLFVAVKDKSFIIAHIGDGVIGYLKDNQLKIATQPENGEFTNTTVFTTSKNAIVSFRMIKGHLGNISGFTLMSDGTAESLYDKKSKSLAEVIKKVMQSCIFLPTEKVETQLQVSLEETISQVTMDDCSIIMMVNDNDSFLGYSKMDDLEKIKLLEINPNSSVVKKQLKRYNRILLALQEKMTLSCISHEIHLKEKYTRKHLDKLIALNLLERDDNGYQTIVRMQ